jgi:hypothetical protein
LTYPIHVSRMNYRTKLALCQCEYAMVQRKDLRGDIFSVKRGLK